MMEQIRQNPKDAIIAIASVLAIVVGLVLVIPRLFGGDELSDAANTRTMIDVESGELFVDLPLPSGAEIPFTNPKTGEATLYPAEPCHWTADGEYKIEPTWVLLNQYKNDSSVTICPDCGKSVYPHNPLPPQEIMLRTLQREAAAQGKP